MQQFQPASFFSSARFQRSRPAVLMALLVITLGVTACSRQADGPFEPVDGSTPTLQSTPVSQSVNGTVVAGSDFTGSTTGTLPPLPTEESGDATIGDAGGSDAGERIETEEADAVAVFTLDPNAPPIFTLAASATWTAAPDTGDESATEDVTPTLSGDFITPGGPIGPVDLSGAGTAEAGSGAGDLLPTPTNLIDFGDDDSDTADVDEECIYIVQRGDSLFSISLDLEVALDDLRAINPEVQDTDVIQVDQELIIPDCDEDFVVSTDEVDEEDSAAALPTPASSNEDSSTGTGRTHTVAAGETLFIIAQEYDVTIDAIVEANSLTNPNQLDIGQVLVIPDSE